MAQLSVRVSFVFLHIFLFSAYRVYGKTCYGLYGCFDDPGVPEAPEAPEKMKVRFQLTNRDIRTQVSCYGLDIEILPNKTNLGDIFNMNLPTKVIIPGWLEGGGVEWVKELIKALLALEDCNVVFVNWRYGSLLSNYPQSKWNTKLLGRMIGEFFNRIAVDYSYDLNNVHIYGHSLGAHAAGIAGAWTNAQIGTITGLDPAGPLFHRAPPSERLDPSDAKFVLILHTDSGHYYETHLGISKSTGHVDLYPNGGYNQPGCEMDHRMINLASSYPNLNPVVDNIFSCSHRRAIDLLLESLTNTLCKFVAYKCSTYEDFEKDLCNVCEEDNCIVFGPRYFPENKQPQQGSYFFKTDATPLYCLADFNYQPSKEEEIEEPEHIIITAASTTATPEPPLFSETDIETETDVDPQIESEIDDIEVFAKPVKEEEEEEEHDDDNHNNNDESHDDDKNDANRDDDERKDDDVDEVDEIEDDFDEKDIDGDDKDDGDDYDNNKRKHSRRNKKFPLRFSKDSFRDEMEGQDDAMKENQGLPLPRPYWSRQPSRAYPYPYPIVFD